MKTLLTLFILLAQLTMAQSRTDGFAQGTRGLPYGMPRYLYTNLVLFTPNWESPSNQIPWTVFDRSQDANNAIQINATSRPVWTNATLVFDGNDDSINCTTGFPFSTGAFTALIWMKRTNLTKTLNQMIAWTGAYPAFYIQIRNPGLGTNISFRTHNGTSNHDLNGLSPINDTNWRMITCTRNASGLKNIYINQTSDVTGTSDSAYNIYNAAPYIFGSSAGQPVNCSIGVVMIFKIALTADEISYIYNALRGIYGL